MVNQRSSVRGLFLSAAAVLVVVTAGCGGRGKNPISSGTVQGIVAVPQEIFVAQGGRTASDACSNGLCTITGATVDLAAANADSTCPTTTTGTIKSGATDATGKWSASSSTTGKVCLVKITTSQTDYNTFFTTLLPNLSDAARSTTVTVGSTAAPPPAFNTDIAQAAATITNQANYKDANAYNAVGNQINTIKTTPSSTVGVLTVNAVVDDPVSGSVNVTGLSVSVGGTALLTGGVGEAIRVSPFTTAKTITVVLPTGSNLYVGTAPTATLAGGASASVTVTLSRVISGLALTSTTTAISSAGTHNLAPACSYGATTGVTPSFGALTGQTCPTGGVTYSTPSQGTISGNTYTAPGTVAADATVNVTGTVGTGFTGGAAVTATATIGLTPCPTNFPDPVPSGGCGVLKTVTAAASDTSPSQHSTLTVALTATCAYDTTGDTNADKTGENCTSSATFKSNGTPLSGATLSLATAGTFNITAEKSAAAGTVASSQVAVTVAARVLNSITLASSASSISYATGSPSPATATITATCAYNSGTYAESANCGTVAPATAITQTLSPATGSGTLASGTYTPPSASPDSDGSVTVTYTSGNVSGSVSIGLLAGPQSCTGVTGFCVDIVDATDNNNEVTITVRAQGHTPNLAAWKHGMTWNTTELQVKDNSSSNVAAATGWTSTTNLTTGKLLVNGINANGVTTSPTDLYTVTFTVLSGAGATVRLTPVPVGTDGVTFGDNSSNTFNPISLRTGTITNN